MQAQGGLHAVVALMVEAPSPRIAMLAARLVSSFSGRDTPYGMAAQWRNWMGSRGLAAVRQAADRMPADETLFSFLAGLLLQAPRRT